MVILHYDPGHWYDYMSEWLCPVPGCTVRGFFSPALPGGDARKTEACIRHVHNYHSKYWHVLAG